MPYLGELMSQNERFPEDISYGSIGGPAFSTSISELQNGQEQRKINWAYPRCRYNVVYGVKSHSQFAMLRDFFYAHRGRALPFRFKDWTDYKAVRQHLGVGNGTSLSLQLVKKYSGGDKSFFRTISKPVYDTIKIYLEEKLLQQNQDYLADCETGRINFTIAPKSGTNVYAEFEFDVLTRFDTDFLACTLEGYGNYGCDDIPLVEVRC